MPKIPYQESIDLHIQILQGIPEGPEKEATAREFRRKLGFEKRLSSSRDNWLGKTWNWFIDAEYTSLAPPPYVWFGAIGLLTFALVLLVVA